MGGVVRSTISQWRLWRSVKHEDVYLKGYATMGELTLGLTTYFTFYNGERPYQSLGQQTSDVVYRTATGGGAMILDKFKGRVSQKPSQRPSRKQNPRGSADPLQVRPSAKLKTGGLLS